LGLRSWLSQFRARQYAEGEYREGPYYLPRSGGWLSADAGRYLNWWQNGHSLQDGPGSNHMVEACRASYAQTVAMCPGSHWQWQEANGRSRVTTSALNRLIRQPNDYQSISDFMLNLVYSLMDGEAFALAQRNDRFEVIGLHLFHSRSSFAQVAEDGSIFYALSGNEIVENRLGQKKLVVPARDVLHLRLHTPRHPLVGESPMVHAALQLAAGNAALQQQVIFYANQAKPSFILTTDQKFTPEQARQLREIWDEQSKGFGTGGSPIATAGLKPVPIQTSSVDAQLADLLKLTDQAIANVYRVPLQMLGMGTTTYASTEALMQQWLASGLGFVLNHIEEAIGILFKLKGQPDEYLEFDTAALQRSSFKDRVEAWAAGVKGGVFPRNAALSDFEMAPVVGGDEVWVQQQDLPISVALNNAKNPPEPPAPAPAPVPEPDGNAAASFEADFRQHLTEHLDAA
jgi:HK97 family phage portal protein